ncbi:Klhl5 protein [Aphelenchoides avenae]|nr:Klhl5 protein [Aphelenchus avenae]
MNSPGHDRRREALFPSGETRWGASDSECVSLGIPAARFNEPKEVGTLVNDVFLWRSRHLCMPKRKMSDYSVKNGPVARRPSLSSTASSSRDTVVMADGTHAEYFLRNLHTSQRERHLCDVEIECEDRLIPAHRVVLASAIEYFALMFRSNMTECRQKTVKLEGITFDALEKIVNFAYSAEVEITEESCFDLLHAANFLGVKFVRKSCEDFLIKQINTENCLQLRDFADHQGCLELVDAVDKYLSDNFTDMCKRPHFVNIGEPNLSKILSFDCLAVSDEKQVFEFVLKWVADDEATRLSHLAGLLSKVRLIQLPLDYFLSNVRNNQLILQCEQSREIVTDAMAKFLQLISDHTSGVTGDLSISPGDVRLLQLNRAESLAADDSSNLATRRQPAGVIFCIGGRGCRLDPYRSVEVFDWRNSRWLTSTELLIGRRHQCEQSREIVTDAMAKFLQLISDHTSGVTGDLSISPGDVRLLQLNRAESLAADDSSNLATRRQPAGVIFCIGGRGCRLDPYRSVEVFDWRNSRWLTSTELLIGRRHVGVVALDNKIYAIGGHDGSNHLNSVECLDIAVGKWREVAPLQTARRGMAVAALGKAIYAVGGLDDQTCYKSMERYDPETNRWTEVASMNVERGGVAVATYGGCLYAIGGNNGTQSLNSCERYDPIRDKWESLPNMQFRRAGAGVAMMGASVYVIGGFDDDAPLPSCERFDIREGTWSVLPPLTRARGGVGVAALAGQVFAIGGHDGSSYLRTVETFDPVKNEWMYNTSINQKRAGAGVTWSPCSILDLQHITNVPRDAPSTSAS